MNLNFVISAITSLVNFSLYKKYFISKDLFVENVLSQGEFLQKMGIIDRINMVSNKMNLYNKSILYSLCIILKINLKKINYYFLIKLFHEISLNLSKNLSTI